MQKLNLNQRLAIIIGLLAAGYVWMAFHIPTFPLPRPVDSELFPKVLGLSLLILAVLLFFEKTGQPVEEETQAQPGPFFFSPPMRVTVTSVAIAGYAFLLQPLGFVLASTGLCFGLASYYGYRHHLINLAVSTGVVLSLYLLMSYVMDVHLPSGVLPF
ncbi:tripartite tricarboxylate transporter TctB family protein [Zobellella aerophila]